MFKQYYSYFRKALLSSLCLVILVLYSSIFQVAFAETDDVPQATGVASALSQKHTFIDIPAGSHLLPYINYLTSRRIINGFPDGTFRPIESVTRAQAAKVLTLAKGLTPTTEVTPSFNDVSRDYWAFGVIEAAVKAGLLKGYPDGTFQPDNPITRAEAVTLLIRLSGGELTGIGSQLNDIDSSYWAYQEIATAVQAGLVDLPVGHPFQPEIPFQRGELVRGVSFVLVLGPELRSTELTGKLVVKNGRVSLISADGSTSQVRGETKVVAGDRISTLPGSKAEINFNDGSGLLLESETDITISKAKGLFYMQRDGTPGVTVDKLVISMQKGRMFGALSSRHDDTTTDPKVTAGKLLNLATTQIPADLKNILLAEGETFSPVIQEIPWWAEPYYERERVVVDMPYGVAGIRGSYWMIDISAGGHSISLMIGKADVTAGNKTINLTEGQYTIIPAAGQTPTSASPFTPELKQAWTTVTEWVIEHAEQIGLSIPPGMEPSISVTLTPMDEPPAGAQNHLEDARNIFKTIIETFNETTGGGGDGGGNSGGGSHDNNPPVVISTNQDSTETGLPSAITITFSENILESEGFNGIQLWSGHPGESGAMIVEATFNIEGNNLIIHPSTSLNYNSTTQSLFRVVRLQILTATI